MTLATALAPGRSRRSPLRELRSLVATDSEWSELCRESFITLTGYEPMMWKSESCISILDQAGPSVVKKMVMGNTFNLYPPSGLLPGRDVGRASLVALVGAALARPEIWGSDGHPQVLVGHFRWLDRTQIGTLRRLVDAGLRVGIDEGIGWVPGVPYQIRIWTRGALPEPTAAEQASLDRFLAFA